LNQIGIQKNYCQLFRLPGKSFTYLVDGANADAEATAAMRTIARIILFDFVELNLKAYAKKPKSRLYIYSART